MFLSEPLAFSTTTGAECPCKSTRGQVCASWTSPTRHVARGSQELDRTIRRPTAVYSGTRSSGVRHIPPSAELRRDQHRKRQVPPSNQRNQSWTRNGMFERNSCSANLCSIGRNSAPLAPTTRKMTVPGVLGDRVLRGGATAREYILDVLEERNRNPTDDPWKVEDFDLIEIAPDNFLATYTLIQDARVTRPCDAVASRDQGLAGGVSPGHGGSARRRVTRIDSPGGEIIF